MLVALAEEALTELSEWQAVYKGSVAAHQRELMATDQAAKGIRHFQPSLIPGPFQTADYARAAIRGSAQTGEPDVEQAVADRLERGDRIVRRRGLRYHAIVTEAGIRWRPAGCASSTRQVQWKHLIDMAAVPHVTLQVLAIDAELVPTPMVGFLAVTFKDPEEPGLVRMETPAIQMVFSGADQVASFDSVWERMLTASLSPDDSMDLIRRLIRDERN
ncbi:MAG: DUF5753 domain-containing protein [Nocardioides sp.]